MDIYIYIYNIPHICFHIDVLLEQMRWLEHSCVLVHLVNASHPNGISIYLSRHTCGDQACKDHSLDVTRMHQTKDKS